MKGCNRANLRITEGLLLHTGRLNSGTAGPLPALFDSPVLKLVEGVYENHPSSARHHLRRPIEVDRPLSFAEKALVQVAAKRVRVMPLASSPSEMTSGKELDPVEFHPSALRGDRVGTLGEVRILLQSPEQRLSESGQSEALYLLDRPIRAAWISPQGKVLALERNQGGRIRCRHAEMNLLRTLSLTRTELPAEGVLVSSLKPCRMCAAFIASATKEFRSLQVLYLKNDLGALAQKTALDSESSGRLEFLRMEKDLQPSQAKKIVALREYSMIVQLSAEHWEDSLPWSEILSRFKNLSSA